MSPSFLPNLPSFRRQQLLLDFNIYKDKFPQGIYLSVTPADPSSWSGVFFARTGPYGSALLRFQIYFPDDYPNLPPLITISTDIFHPLIVPLTTYTFSTGVFDTTSTVSATDEDRLPPGAFCLRHGFPTWFARSRRRQGSRNVSYGSSTTCQDENVAEPAPLSTQRNELEQELVHEQRHSIIQVLEYMKAAFESAELLDDIPLQYAGNPSAWHAWRAHRGLPKPASRAASPAMGHSENRSPQAKNPGDWNWDGVWEARVRNGIEASLSESTLFGSSSSRPPNEPIRFAKFDQERLDEARGIMLS